MKLLQAEPQAAPDVAAEAPSAPELPDGTTACRTCGAPMEPGQDWCLECGTAAKGTLGQRPEWRAARTVLALTALLVLGAAGASYAALTDDGTKPPAASTAVAQAPVATPPPATTPPAAAPTTTPTATKPPKIKAPKATSTPTPAPTAVTPTVTPSATPSTPAPTSSGAPITGSTSTGSTSTGSTSTSGEGEGSGNGNSSSTTPAAPSPVVLASNAASLFDPYHRAATSGTPANAIDGNPSSSWFVEPTPKPGTGPDVGLVVDLGAKRDLRGLRLRTTTPGFRVEIYATDVASPPQDILDARWSHLLNRGDVGTDESIAIRNDPTKYRLLLLWFTKPPTDGTRIRVNDLEVLS